MGVTAIRLGRCLPRPEPAVGKGADPSGPASSLSSKVEEAVVPFVIEKRKIVGDYTRRAFITVCRRSRVWWCVDERQRTTINDRVERVGICAKMTSFSPSALSSNRSYL